jgi:hypothetical protein
LGHLKLFVLILGLGWWPRSSCAKFKWSGYEAIMVSDDLLLSSHAAGWVSFSFSMDFGMLKSHFLFWLENMDWIVCSPIFSEGFYH